MKNTLLSSLVVAAACGSSDKPATPPVTFDVPGVNALVPAALEDKLVFEQRDIVEERGRDKLTFTVVAPKGWTQTMKGFARIKPTDHELFMTSFDVGTNCDGLCKAKDWAAVSEKANFSQFRGDTIVDEKKLPTSHLLVAEKGDTTYVMYAWWTDGAPRYNTCMASLEAPVRAAAPAFAKACQAVAIKGAN